MRLPWIDNKTRAIGLTLILLLSPVMLSCGGDEEDGGGDRPGETAELPFVLDPSMPEEEKELVREDFAALRRLRLSGGDVDYFNSIFGGRDASAVLGFIRPRVNYIVPRFTNLFRRLRVNGSPVDTGFNPIPDEPNILAINPSAGLWILNLIEPGDVKFQFGNQLLDLDSSRSGIISLGPGYTGAESPIDRVAVHVHEARHSDCTGGLSQEELELRTTVGESADPACGHRHVLCPPGHNLAGLPGCDAHAWGAYAVGMVFNDAVAHHCPNCSAEERSAAQISFLESANRILVLDEMLDGDLGSPNMSSSGLRR